MEQFEVVPIVPIEAGGFDISFTNASLWMCVVAGAVALFLSLGASSRALVPTRMQSLAELSYTFIADMIRSTAGTAGMRFFPFVFTLFMFVLFANLIGLLPPIGVHPFTVTSHIIVTFALAMLVITTVIVYGFMRNGIGFLKLFWPSDIPIFVMPLIVPIEVLSFLSRPVSLSVRLFANMLAGHIALKVFASFILMLGGFGVLGYIGAVLPFAMTVALTALELLVAFLQAYVFAILTCMYLNDALHPSH